MLQLRLYLYIVAAASLGMLVVGLANLGAITTDLLLSKGAIEQTYRQAFATFGALSLVGLPVWALHWGIAQRRARDRPDELASALRRLYIYLVAGVLLFAATIFARRLLDDLLSPLVTSERLDAPALARAGCETLLLLGFWGYHFRTASRDRAFVGEEAASATLRRWYAYAVLLVGLALLLLGARNLLQSAWVDLLQRGQLIGPDTAIPSAIATTVVGLGVWLFHTLWIERGSLAADDRLATLRAVHSFAVLAASVMLALTSASQLLYYSLARTLGIRDPAGVSGDLMVALAAPTSTLLVFTASWIVMRQRLAHDSAGAEANRQVGVRRLYGHLVALLALATLAIGLSGLIWTLSDQLLSAALGRPAGEWRDQVSLFATLAVVGLPMWLTYWRPTAEAAVRQSLSRRLFLYAALLGSVLALLISAATLVYRLLSLILTTSQATSGDAVIDIGRAFSVIVVAAGLATYHWRFLRQESALRTRRDQAATAEVRPATEIPLQLEIVGASVDEVRRALVRLPPGATYTFGGSPALKVPPPAG